VSDAGTDSGQVAREMELVTRALSEALLFFTGVDMTMAALNVRPVEYSPLRTRLEQALPRAAAVLAYLRGQPAPRPRSGP
jgi:hypothetical protein